MIQKAFSCFCRDGFFYRLPEGYELPCVDVATFWSLWWLGDRTTGIPPLRLVESRDSSDCSLERTQKTLSDWKTVMKFLDSLLEAHCPSLDRSYSSATSQFVIEAFSQISNHLQRPDRTPRGRKRWITRRINHQGCF
jgi:hypothetical protein